VFNNERVDHAPSGRGLGPLLYGFGAWLAIEGGRIRKVEVIEIEIAGLSDFDAGDSDLNFGPEYTG
jgi:hypothetical protein